MLRRARSSQSLLVGSVRTCYARLPPILGSALCQRKRLRGWPFSATARHLRPTIMRLAYYFRKEIVESAETAQTHEQILDVLMRLSAEGRIAQCIAQDVDAAFPTRETEETLFARLREFAARHKVGLSRPFGSRRRGFCYLPPAFLLVFEEESLREVFPCRIGDDEVTPLEYLNRLAGGQPWTNRSSRGMAGKKHAALVAQIVANPDILEPGLRLRGNNVQVSQDFGELGYVDLIFQDSTGRPLLLEVKVDPSELDKAIGQILRHRHLFGQQNHIRSVRVGIACPYIPAHYDSICAPLGISRFRIPHDHPGPASEA